MLWSSAAESLPTYIYIYKIKDCKKLLWGTENIPMKGSQAIIYKEYTYYLYKNGQYGCGMVYHKRRRRVEKAPIWHISIYLQCKAKESICLKGETSQP